jgi:uncharacterized protein YciI
MLWVGRTQNKQANAFGIGIFGAENEDATRVIVANDPAVKNGVVRAKLYPYRIALMCTR